MQDDLRILGLPDEFHEVAGNLPQGLSAAELVARGYAWYQSKYDTSAPGRRSTNGRVFEGLVLLALHNAGIHPIYYQASVAHIPQVVYDILLYDTKQPIVLSCKVSLRERWKQADLEAAALRQVYRGAQSVLLTLSASEGRRLQRQIESSDVLGLDECIVIQSKGDRFDGLISKLEGMKFTKATPIMPVEGKILP